MAVSGICSEGDRFAVDERLNDPLGGHKGHGVVPSLALHGAGTRAVREQEVHARVLQPGLYLTLAKLQDTGPALHKPRVLGVNHRLHVHKHVILLLPVNSRK